MPTVTLPFNGGQPIIKIGVWVSTPRRNALAAAKQSIPSIQWIDVLIDTGASCTCVDPLVVAALGITPSGVIGVHTPSTSGTPVQQNLYDVDIGVLLSGSQFHLVSTLLGANLACQGIHGLLGRDVLSQGMLFFNGVEKTFTIAF